MTTATIAHPDPARPGDEAQGEPALSIWGPVPPAHLLGLAPFRFWRDHQVLPLQIDHADPRQVLVVASSQRNLPAETLRALQVQGRRPIQLVPAAADDIRLWLDTLSGARTWAEALAEGVGRSLAALGVASPEDLRSGPRPRLEGASLAVDQIEASFGLSESLAVELLALRARVPRVRLEKYRLGMHLRALLDVRLATELSLVPLVAHGGTLVIASPAVHPLEVWRRLEAETGLRPRLCLCAPSTFVSAFERVYAEEELEPFDAGEADLLAQLVHLGTLDEDQQARVIALARVTRESFLAVTERLGYARDLDIALARASLLRMSYLDEGQFRVDEEMARRASPELWRRWQCVPTREGGSRTTLVAAGPLPPSVVRMVAHLLEVPARVALTTPRHLQQAQASLPAADRQPYRAQDHLLEGGLVAAGAEALRLARRAAARGELPLVSALLTLGAITLEDLVEARAIALDCPWVHLDHFTPEAAVVETVPEELARQERVLPLQLSGPALTAAFLNDRGDELPLSALARATSLTISPVLAVTEDPDQAIARWYERGAGPLARAYRDFGRFLVRRGLLAQVQIDAIWSAMARQHLSFDAALHARGLLTDAETARALADFLGVETAKLEMGQQFYDYIDALGQPRREIGWHDPVDHGVARLLPRAVAEAAAALPIRQRGEAVVVAMVDPLDDNAQQAVAAALRAPIIIQVAERRPLEVALRRVWQSASLGERLLRGGLITPHQLRRALDVHDTARVRLGQALLNLGYVTPRELAQTLADQNIVPFFDLEGVQPDPETARLMPPPVEGDPRFLPLFRDPDGTLVVATPDPLSAEELAAATAELGGGQARQVVVTEPAFAWALDAVFREDFRTHSASALLARSPEQSARWVLSRGQKIALIGLLALGALGTVRDPVATGTILLGFSTLFYLAFSAYKFYLTYRAVTHTLEVEVSEDEVAALDERLLPIYTVLVPLYREASVLPGLIKAIDALDYPKAKLDVKLLLEEDDVETIAAARAARLASHFKLVIVPQGKPKGKPKACNYGLIHARGEFVVIYDAEDLPEPDQLKKALAAFSKASEQVACVQAKLNYYNRDQNLLTRWFTTEYSMWFDLFLPGLDASDAPIPLGGTSNHFRTAQLRELGAWDPYNVTEDADLGVRLFKAGWKTAVIDSTTYEEANSDLYNWVRQRSRWVKGYIQTYLVHMRHPLRLLRQMGWRAFLSYQMVVGGTFFGYLMNPILWLLTAGWFLGGWGWIKLVYPAPLYYLGAFSLYVGNFAFVYLNVVGCLRREYYDMVKYALLSPIYWGLMSLAAWKGFLQLFYAPSYWEKTKHGLYEGEIAITPANRLQDLF